MLISFVRLCQLCVLGRRAALCCSNVRCAALCCILPPPPPKQKSGAELLKGALGDTPSPSKDWPADGGVRGTGATIHRTERGPRHNARVIGQTKR